MELTEVDLQLAQTIMASKKEAGHAISVSVSFENSKFTIVMNTGLELTVPFSAVTGLSSASITQVQAVEITPSGTGLLWPEINAALFIPSLLNDIAGSKNWFAKNMGAAGGQTRTAAKSLAARQNGRQGGRPKKTNAA